MKKTTRTLSLILVACLLIGLASVVDAGNRIGSRRALLRVGEEIRYLLRATFSVGDVALNAGDIETQAPGSVEDGTLTAVETDGTLAIVSNKCAFTAQGTPAWGDLGFYSQAIERALGRGLLGTVNLDATNKDGPRHSWTDAQNVNVTDELYVFAFADTGDLYAQVWDGAGGVLESNILLSFSASTDYQLAIILGGYLSGVPWYQGQDKATYTEGAWFAIKGGAFTDWSLLWRTDQGSTATLYAAFSNYDTAGTIDNFLVPDADLSAVLQPNNLSTFDAPNGTSLDAIVPEVGASWVEQSGDWDIQGNRAKAKGASPGGPQWVATVDSGESDVIADCVVNFVEDADNWTGIVLRYSNGDNLWLAYITGGGTDEIGIRERNGGSWTARAAAAFAPSVSTDYDVRAIAYGQTIDAFVDGGTKISYASAALNETATIHGLRQVFASGSAEQETDNFAIFSRQSSVYDSVLDAY